MCLPMVDMHAEGRTSLMAKKHWRREGQTPEKRWSTTPRNRSRTIISALTYHFETGCVLRKVQVLRRRAQVQIEIGQRCRERNPSFIRLHWAEVEGGYGGRIDPFSILVAIDRKTKSIFAHMVQKKGYKAHAITILGREI